MASCNPAKTPMGNDIQLPVLNKTEVNITEYQRYIGSLMYLMICTQPDIAYSVGVLSHHVSCPGKAHVQAVKRIFRYLQETSQYRLEYQSDDKVTSGLQVFMDSDWAGD